MHNEERNVIFFFFRNHNHLRGFDAPDSSSVPRYRPMAIQASTKLGKTFLNFGTKLVQVMLWSVITGNFDCFPASFCRQTPSHTIASSVSKWLKPQRGISYLFRRPLLSSAIPPLETLQYSFPLSPSLYSLPLLFLPLPSLFLPSPPLCPFPSTSKWSKSSPNFQQEPGFAECLCPLFRPGTANRHPNFDVCWVIVCRQAILLLFSHLR